MIHVFLDAEQFAADFLQRVTSNDNLQNQIKAL